MSTQGGTTARPPEALSNPRFIALAYDSANAENSVLRLVYTIFPEWEDATVGKVEFTQLTEGKTNLILKVVFKRALYSKEQIDQDAVLVRVYGSGTSLLTCREREWNSHYILAQYKLAPPLLARFENGLIYRFTPGRTCDSVDLGKESVWRGVARKMGEWHAILPIPGGVNADLACSSGVSTPYSIWELVQKWISALPNASPKEKECKIALQVELDRLIQEFSDIRGIGPNHLVFGHCDILGANVVIQPLRDNEPPREVESVTFIDYEYALPCPAAFDISNHFAEWAGFECDYDLLPTRSTRRAFLAEYVRSYHEHSQSCRSQTPRAACEERNLDEDIEQLFVEVDRFRGVPGFFWAVCALIQALAPQTEFDYLAYADLRLVEYWAWMATEDGTQSAEKSLRERRWAQEE
ncbi:ethanolamine kinase 1 [Terfezia claveryi]|nr:ethanolamine kinase 1 [Terfezia claveryi]